MSEKKVFCEKCRDDVEYIETTEQMYGAIKDRTYQYVGKEAHCVNCGSELYVPEFLEYNLDVLYDIFRKENDIIPLKQVREIPKKYAIGKRPLSLLLGWGEQTFSRYAEGDVPTKQYSDMLLRIYNDPAFYADLLEKNKDKLKSNAAYEKSRKAVSSLLIEEEPSTSKINTVVKYVISNCEDITPLSLQKALYYIQGFYFAFYNSFLFFDDCLAWTTGPAYKDVYYLYRDYQFGPAGESINLDKSVFTSFSSSEKAVYDSVINNVCCYSGKVLERFTRNETPWIVTRGELPDSVQSDRVIEKSLIGDYFNSVKRKYDMINPNDIKEYTLDMFSS